MTRNSFDPYKKQVVGCDNYLSDTLKVFGDGSSKWRY